ncbi:butyrate kinase [Tetragenococcus halophilus]|uniref:butyrate kinase n=1 Tax=Tetragenococcus halophilus TaxID=51669 RepID=UPI0030F3692E
MNEKVLVINPGSTSTKLAIYEKDEVIVEKTIEHESKIIDQFKTIPDQKDFRKKTIISFLNDENIQVNDLTAIVGRGGLLRPIVGGTYRINEKMINDLEKESYGSHASNLGAILANEIAQENSLPAYIVDPVVVDEFNQLARISGLAGIEKRSVGHTLNQKAVAREVLEKKGKSYKEGKVIVVHLGGGISIGAHDQGEMVEMVNGLDGEGPYSPERTGSLPLIDFAEKIIDDSMTIDQVKKMIAGKGGLKSYLNETDVRIIQKNIEAGDSHAKLYLDGMIYQISRSIGSIAPVLKGEIDYIILTGGISYSDYLVSAIKEYTDWIAEIEVVPGEKEMEALYQGVKRVIDKKEMPKEYIEDNVQEEKYE